MNSLRVVSAIGLWICIALQNSGCQRNAADRKAAQADFATVVRVELRYRVGGKLDQLVTVSDEKQVKELMASFRIDDVDKGTQAGGGGKCIITFHLKDAKPITTMLLDTDHLDRSFWGQLYLKDDAFYRKLCEIASKDAGKKIDVLEGN